MGKGTAFHGWSLFPSLREHDRPKERIGQRWPQFLIVKPEGRLPKIGIVSLTELRGWRQVSRMQITSSSLLPAEPGAICPLPCDVASVGDLRRVLPDQLPGQWRSRNHRRLV